MKETVIYCKKEKVKCMCHGCKENKTERTDGKCSGCLDCGKCSAEKCLMI